LIEFVDLLLLVLILGNEYVSDEKNAFVSLGDAIAAGLLVEDRNFELHLNFKP
jgi:hypothetical protein